MEGRGWGHCKRGCGHPKEAWLAGEGKGAWLRVGVATREGAWLRRKGRGYREWGVGRGRGYANEKGIC